MGYSPWDYKESDTTELACSAIQNKKFKKKKCFAGQTKYISQKVPRATSLPLLRMGRMRPRVGSDSPQTVQLVLETQQSQEPSLSPRNLTEYLAAGILFSLPGR